MSRTVKLPNQLNLQGSCEFSCNLHTLVDIPEVDIDFSSLRFARPHGTLIIANSIRKFQRLRGEGYKTRALNVNYSNNAHSYLMHIGFFHFIGLEIGNNVGDASGSNTYIPINTISKDDVEKGAQELGLDAKDAILNKSEEMANLIIHRVHTESVNAAISYSIREIMRNVFEHSQSQSCFFCGQRYGNGIINLSLFDEGRGLLKSLQESHDIESDIDAIKLAVRPGMSRVNLTDGNNEFDNSGFGLYVLSEIGKSFGSFSILSRSVCTSYMAGREPIVRNVNIDGTLIALMISKPLCSFTGVLDDIVKAGEEEAKEAGNVIGASKWSKLPNKSLSKTD